MNIEITVVAIDIDMESRPYKIVESVECTQLSAMYDLPVNGLKLLTYFTIGGQRSLERKNINFSQPNICLIALLGY